MLPIVAMIKHLNMWISNRDASVVVCYYWCKLNYYVGKY